MNQAGLTRKGTSFGAFTLIELLVVIAIIVVLAALLLPVLSRTKARAQATACLSNVKQWGYAFWMYEDEHDDYFPYEGNFGSLAAASNADAWYNSTAAYLSQPTLLQLYTQGHPPRRGTHSVFICPSARDRGTLPTVTRPFFAYGFNNRMDPNGPARFRRSQVLKPVQTVTFTENNESSYPSTSGVYAPARHALRCSLAFVDGHAELVRTNDYSRRRSEDTAPADWSKPRVVYWFPYPDAPL